MSHDEDEHIHDIEELKNLEIQLDGGLSGNALKSIQEKPGDVCYLSRGFHVFCGAIFGITVQSLPAA